jgi:hypothetical protein
MMNNIARTGTWSWLKANFHHMKNFNFHSSAHKFLNVHAIIKLNLINTNAHIEQQQQQDDTAAAAEGKKNYSSCVSCYSENDKFSYMHKHTHD